MSNSIKWNQLNNSLIIISAITSRLLVLSLIVLSRTFIHPYDTSSPINPNCLANPPQQQQHIIFPRISAAIQNSVVWDSVYFIRIAECGYEYEQSFAFLPLLPLLLSFLSRTVFAPLIPLIGLRAVLALAGYFVNNVAFVITAICFYRLSVIILKDNESALRASVLFCFNPASIFYSSIYTESLYALFSIGGLYCLISGANNLAVLSFALSSCTRSNGVLNAGYLCFQTLHHAYDALIINRRVLLAVQVILVGALRCALICVPFIAFQAYGYFNICHGRSPGEMRPWCKASVPLLYGYIQSHYWGVGFLRYFQLKQLPNFLLATPILSLAISCIINYVQSQPDLFFSLGLKVSNEGNRSEATVQGSDFAQFKEKSSTRAQATETLRRRKHTIGEVALHEEYDSWGKPGHLHALIIPCTLHLGFMVTTAFFVMHVQVATRFLSASPPLYWFSSYIMTYSGTGKRLGYIIWAYCSAYILLGGLLFSIYYPFT